MVCDLTRAVAGPFCTMLLGDLGAEIIKVEEPAGDETRGWGPPFLGEDSTYFLGLNRNKTSLTADLKTAAGLQTVKDLALRADVFVENFRPGVLERLGLSYETMAAANPRLIYASVSGFGVDGPDRGRPGYDLIVQAMSGLMRLNSTAGGQPAKTGFPIADILAAMFLGQAIQAALFRRERTGEGARIEVSLFECLLAAMSPAVSSILLAGVEPKPMGGGQANIVPYQTFQSADGLIAIASPNDRIWHRFAQALEQPQWLTDPRFEDNARRTENREVLVAAVEAVVLGQTSSYWVEKLKAASVPCGAVQSITDALNEPQLAARGAIVNIDDPVRGAMRIFANPIHMSGCDIQYNPPPVLDKNLN